MKIIRMKRAEEKDGVFVECLMEKRELKALNGEIDDIVLFSAETINIASKAIRTGAKANMARYLLCPKALRRKCKADEYDFDKICCGYIEGKTKLFIVYCLEGKGIVRKQ